MAVDLNNITFEGVKRWEDIRLMTDEDRERLKFWHQPAPDEFHSVLAVQYSYRGISADIMTFDATLEGVPDEVIWSMRLPSIIEACENYDKITEHSDDS
jgi:hypothetical protein